MADEAYDGICAVEEATYIGQLGGIAGQSSKPRVGRQVVGSSNTGTNLASGRKGKASEGLAGTSAGCDYCYLHDDFSMSVRVDFINYRERAF